MTNEVENADNFQQQQFRLSSRQKSIAEKLHNLIGPSLRSMYVDACRLVETDTKLQSEALLVGHLVREIESALKEVLLPMVTEQEQQNLKSHKERIRAITAVLDIEENDLVCQSWLEISDRLHVKGHRRGLARPEPIDDDFKEQHWNKFEHILLGLLLQLEKTYLKFLEKVDELKSEPTAQNAKFIKKWFPNNFIFQRRFFEDNERKEWVSLLKESTLFTQPPDMEALDDEEYINPPHWPVMDYLRAMAATKDTGVEDDIVSVVQSLPETQNIRVNSDIVAVAMALPPEKSLLLEDRIKQGLSDLSGSIFMRDFSGLIKHWSTSGDRALAFAAWLFDVEPTKNDDNSYKDRFQTRFKDYDYKDTIQNSLEPLMAVDTLGAFQLFCGLLDKALNIECKGEPDNEYTYISRADIGESQSYKTELNTLIDAVRDSSIQIVKENPERYAEIAALLESYEWQIFKRIGVYLLSRFPQADTEKLEETLVNRENFDDHPLYYDYRSLAKAGFGLLPESGQTEIISWLDELSDLDRITQWYEENKNRTPTEADIERIRAERFRHNAYGWHDALPKELQQKYEDIVQKYGEETPVNKVSSSWRGPESPASSETLVSWDTGALIEYLKTWKPEEGIFMPSMEGLGHELTRAVTNSAEQFSKIADQFQSLHPTYIRSFLRGIREGIKQEKEIDWQKTLELCLYAAHQSDDTLEGKPDSWEADETWRWAKHEACDLLKLGFNTDTKHPIPADCRETAWALIEKLLEDENPSEEEEENSARRDEDDYYGVAINSIRSQTIEITVSYCLRLREENENISLQDLPKIKAALDRHLDPAIEPSKAVKAVYGCFFPWLYLLDNGWAAENRDKIFLKPMTHDPAWRAYVTYRKPFSDCYDVLKPLYSAAVQELKGAEINEEHAYFERFCEHLVVHALRNNDKDGLLEALVQNAPDKLLAHIMQFMGRILSDNTDLPDEWRSLIQSHLTNRIPDAGQEELADFGWWIPNNHLGAAWMLEKLAMVLGQVSKISNQENIIEYLKSQTESHMEAALLCLEKILFETDIDYWAISYKKDDIADILRAVLQSDNEALHGKVSEVVNRLVAKGFSSFESLVSQSHPVQKTA